MRTVTPLPASSDAADGSESFGPAPVFVDATGQRRRLISRAAIAVLAIVGAYGVAVVLSFLGGPVPPNALLPIPGLPSAAPSSPASPAKSGATSSGGGNAAHTNSGNAGTSTGTASGSGGSGVSKSSPSPSAPASTSATGNRHVPPGHVGRSASPGPSNGHGH